jgi:hypothetical protein
MWWMPKRHRRELEEVQRRAETAELHADYAEQSAIAAAAQRQRIERQAATARLVAATLQYTVDLNHWTELLQRSWGPR